MQAHSIRVVPKQKQQLRSRIFWFLAGAAVNYTLIAVPFGWLQRNTDLPIPAISAISVGVGVSFFFAWNYFVNFKTDSRKRDALVRYISAVALMWVLSATTLSTLKHFDAKMAFTLFGLLKIDLDIVATQFFLAGIKFFLYHKWVFPLPKEEVVETRESLQAEPAAAQR